MIIPNQLKIRILFTFDGEEFTKFYWFRMNNEDFYWGSSYKERYDLSTENKVAGKEATIQIPKNFETFPVALGKYSYHKSGITHNKIDFQDGSSANKGNSIWLPKKEIKQPVLFSFVITRSIKFYNKKIKNPSKGKTYPIIFRLDKEMSNNRLYFEFFLSPKGKFVAPKPLLRTVKKFNGYTTHSISPDLILIVRYGIISALEGWHPEIEITFIPNELI